MDRKRRLTSTVVLLAVKSPPREDMLTLALGANLVIQGLDIRGHVPRRGERSPCHEDGCEKNHDDELLGRLGQPGQTRSNKGSTMMIHYRIYMYFIDGNGLYPRCLVSYTPQPSSLSTTQHWLLLRLESPESSLTYPLAKRETDK